MSTIERISIDKIRVLNPRSRSKAKFREIAQNISAVGLKKPITVAPRESEPGTFDLVCGQGRMEALAALGETEVFAFVRDIPKEDRLLMSLVENMARRAKTSIETAREVAVLRDGGYTHAQIASKIGVTDAYVSMLLRLVDRGEERLLRAVERGEIPIAVAIEIAAADEGNIQQALADAYTSGKLRGKALLAARRLVELRRARGKGIKTKGERKPAKRTTSDELVSAYRKETQRQKLLVKKARICETRLVFIAGALRRLFDDEHFVTLLRAESLDAVPEYLVDAIRRPAP